MCLNGALNFPCFPPLRTFRLNLDVYVLDDICTICVDDFMTYGVFIVAQLLPKPPGFRLNRLACKLKTTIISYSNIPKRCARSCTTFGSQTSMYYIPHRKIPVIWLVKKAGIILTVPAKMTMACPGHSQSELEACYVPRVKITSTYASMSSRGNYATIASCVPAPFALIMINLVKSLSKWKILSNLAFFFHSVYYYIKQILTAFYSGHSLKL